jgi:hypothetical protein
MRLRSEFLFSEEILNSDQAMWVSPNGTKASYILFLFII